MDTLITRILLLVYGWVHVPLLQDQLNVLNEAAELLPAAETLGETHSYLQV